MSKKNGKSSAKTGKVEKTATPEKSASKRELPPKTVRPLKEFAVKPSKIKESSEPTEPKPKGVRKKATIEGHIENYAKALSLLDTEIDRRSREKDKGVRTFKKVRKLLVRMRKELPVVTRSKAARIKSSTSATRQGGIMIKYQISGELADFLKVPKDTKLSRVETTRAICIYSHLKENEKREEMARWLYLNPEGKRNLQNQMDHKSILPDKALSKLLRYDQYKKDVKAGKIFKNVKDKETGKVLQVKMTDDMLYYWVIQKLVGVHFLKNEPITED